MGLGVSSLGDYHSPRIMPPSQESCVLAWQFVFIWGNLFRRFFYIRWSERNQGMNQLTDVELYTLPYLPSASKPAFQSGKGPWRASLIEIHWIRCFFHCPSFGYLTRPSIRLSQHHISLVRTQEGPSESITPIDR